MKKWIIKSLLVMTTLSLTLSWQPAFTTNENTFWVELNAKDKFERSAIANVGASIQSIVGEKVYALATRAELAELNKLGYVTQSSALVELFDFPVKDSAYHNYAELTDKLQKLFADHSDIMTLSSIGRSHEGRDIWAVNISGNLNDSAQKPAAIFMGGHHAREHLSVEIPLMLVEHLVLQYKAGNAEIQRLIDNRDIHIIPVVNPDGMEFDIATGSYKLWRKNRYVNSDGTYGVDLNRNYGHKWGTGGSSKNTRSDTYMGAKPFSELETQSIKKYVEDHKNINVLLSYHAFSELILYPWGHKYDSIEDQKDFQVHQKMAEKMATWNKYVPQQASDLYIASGDTTDWSYGEHKIISFTFELDPKNNFLTGSKGFYPGAKIIPDVFNKNLPAALYLIDRADDPYRVLAE